ncbi:MAG: SH3 domain-containing protein [Gemmatimonadetes bacterium]|nr:SH3 domain-containing protein [Gemmatimonadota bacterium]
MELQLLAKDAQIDALTRQLDDARQEVVRAMARLRTLATRAEAASGMAEAELAVQSLRAKAERSAPELAQAQQLLGLSGDEFAKENYGGALYLANQAKSAARAGEGRVAAQRLTSRPGEVTFAIPVPLRILSRGNVREGPGTRFPVVYTLEAGAQVLGHSYANDWVRIVDHDGRAGWIARGLVSSRR